MKKRLGLLAMVLLALGVTACGTGGSSSSSEAVDGAVAKLTQAYNSLGALIADPTNITSGFEVPSSLANGVTAEWSSDEPGVIAFGAPANGFVVATVNRPAKGAGNAVVTISALLSLQSEITSEMLHQTWTIDLTVKENTVEELVIENVADILAITDKSYDATLSVTLNDMTIFAKSAGEAFAYDGTGIIQVYAGAASTMAVGKVYTISGTADWYYGIWEITKSTATEQTSATPNYPTKEVITSVQEKITALTTAGEHLSALGDASSGNFEPIYARVTGKIYMIPDDTSNYNTWIMDTNATSYVAGIAKAGDIPETPSNSLMVYYNTSDFSLVRQYAGIVVTLDVVIYTYRSNNHGFAVYYVGGPDGIEASLTDEQKQTIDANSISLPSSITEATTLTLDTTGANGSAIAWTSSNEAVINPTTGVVTIPETGVLVTMTATVTLGALTAIVKTFNVVVGPLENTTMATLLTKAKGDVLYSEAEVLFLASNAKSAIVGDSSGYGYIYSTTALTIEVGKFYGFNYTVDVYNGLYEMTKVTVLTPKGVDPNLTLSAVTWTGAEALALSATAWSPVYVTMELFGYADGTYVNAYLPGFGPGYVQTNGAGAELAGKKFTATGWIIGRSSGAVPSKVTIQGTYTNAVDATEAEQLAVAVGMFKAPAANDAVTANLSLPTTVKFGTVAWTSSDPSVISDAGVVTRPAAGQPDATVTMSYVITVGATSSESVGISFTVKAEEPVIIQPTPELFISEYIEGSSNNKAIEIYNPTGAAVDLSQYTIKQFTNGATTTTTMSTLSGTLAAGDVYVLANASADPAIIAQADYYPAYSTTVFSCGFNGDDAIALYKGETLIDLIGVIGVDPGTNWVVGSGATSEYTLVRSTGIVCGNTTFTASEWVVYPQNTFTYLGSHTAA